MVLVIHGKCFVGGATLMFAESIGEQQKQLSEMLMTIICSDKLLKVYFHIIFCSYTYTVCKFIVTLRGPTALHPQRDETVMNSGKGDFCTDRFVSVCRIQTTRISFTVSSSVLELLF